ncbi:WD repeat-containing protein 6 isoform X2 [Canna indica]|uniref:WD repeat-containing protein 6 isoform X2 n=1 Tax=Canna indica TaxID=4628 RepID=A0AAQ3L1N7_9LILI|nr:WD repeat-containing protein 6 isoform X2 [Canna indica]
MGLSDNSLALWDLTRSNMISRVKSSERCLLYSMRMWGDNLNELRVASGTIFNEIIVWKLIPYSVHPSPNLSMEQSCPNKSGHANTQIAGRKYTPFHLKRLIGHEGSIFRMTWLSDGTKLMSVSDDRSGRIWVISCQNQEFDNFRETPGDHYSSNLTLFGHNARIWDCYISHSIVITAGEDCTCRAWGTNGNQLMEFKEHVGRGIWRCLYDPDSSLLVTAGFDSAIKVHRLYSCSSKEAREQDRILDDLDDHRETFEICAPKLTKQPGQLGLMDSKSEYVRCIQFSRENTLYVATNNGYLYHAELSHPEGVKWTELVQVKEEAQIICMDILSTNFSESLLHLEDIVAIGDGKGKVTVVGLRYDDCSPKVSLSLTWSAEMERQLLGVHWCRSLGNSYLFTSDPRGMMKLWKIKKDVIQSDAHVTTICSAVVLAIFKSSFRHRITSIDASSKEEVLICGDKHGNITLFPFLEKLMEESSEGIMEILPLDHFKGAHGISSVTSICIARSYSNRGDVQTTGADGCICYFKCNKILQKIEFTGMKQVKELSIIQSVFSSSNSEDIASGNYAIGFTSVHFLMWDLANETNIIKIPCGGWRRPYSFHFGVVPEHQNCFAYVKDHIIHVHRLWVVAKEKLFPKALHMQYHGREIHTISFISLSLLPELDEGCHSWIATGCEDGSVRLARYSTSEIGRWSESLLLGEHVGGSAVRSICFIPKIYTFMSSTSSGCTYNSSADGNEDQLLLISVGSKQVLTSWVLKNTIAENGSSKLTSKFQSSVSFQWLSTHMPQKFANRQKKTEKLMEMPEECPTIHSNQISTVSPTECRKGNHDCTFGDQIDNDWRYLAVTAFLVKHLDSSITICFIVVACSDATLMLRALLLPYRLWFDVALLVPTKCPVLSLQHIVVTGNFSSNDAAQIGNAYFLISGSTDGSITFWDLTEAVESFMQLVLDVQPQMFIDCQRRPKTGRGSQGGRWWRSLINLYSGKNGINNNNDLNSRENEHETSSTAENDLMSHPSSTQFRSVIPRRPSNIPCDLREIQPLCVFSSVHQSGVNCLHVSEMKKSQHSKSEVDYCIISGGDDQSLHVLGFSLQVEPTEENSVHDQSTSRRIHIVSATSDKLTGSCFFSSCSVDRHIKLRILLQNRVLSAHSSAVKGVWTDGIWAFSTGLDQRIRCWEINWESGLREHANVIVSVPEPEALDAIFSDSERGKYRIAVAGRGMQMIEFTSCIV